MPKNITFDDLNEINVILQERTDESTIEGANLLMEKLGFKASINRPENGETILREFLNSRLKDKDFLAAATFLFGYNLFDPRPMHMSELFSIANKSSRLSIPGAASSSKSFGIGIWMLMDYIQDPHYTKVFIASMQEKHLRQELFADLIRAVNNSVLDLGLETSSSALKIVPRDSDSDVAGIFGKSFPQDESTSTGRFRGLKPKRRSSPHPDFGAQTRIRIFLDEASSISGGVFMDLGSVEASIEGPEIVKIFMAFNPTNTNHPTCKLSEPDGGIYSLDPDNDYEWVSKAGWQVYRLDGARSPNVLARKNVCAGVMSYEAFRGYLKAGDNSEKYWVYGRGIWAMKGAINNVMPMDFITKNIGEFIFPAGYENIASIDLAFGGDKVVFTLGRWGKAAGYVDKSGKRILFEHDGRPITRWCLQIDQQFEIQGKYDSITLATEIIKLAKQMKVKAKWLCLDRTAIGKGTYDQLRVRFGNVLGINWQEKASKTIITVEDSETPEERYANISSEMWFGFASWLEHGIIKISQFINPTPLFHQLTSRRYKSGRGGRSQVESKPEYKSRGHSDSPDHADSAIQLPLLCRLRGSVIPSTRGLDEDKLKDELEDFDEDNEDYPKSLDEVENLSFEQDDENYNEYDSIEEYAY